MTASRTNAQGTPHKLNPRYFAPDEFIILLKHDDAEQPAALENEIRSKLAGTLRDASLTFPDAHESRSGQLSGPDKLRFAIPGTRQRYSPVVARLPRGSQEPADDQLAVNLFKTFTSVESSLKDASYPIRAISPNWLVGAAQSNGIATGGPGALPTDPAPSAAQHSFAFAKWQPGKRDPARDVHVVILDTLPDGFQPISEQVRLDWLAASSADRMKAASESLRIQLMSRLGHVVQAPAQLLSDDYAISGHLGYDLSRHGPFIAGIIASITGAYSDRVQLHMVEVLNRFGVGSVSSVLWGLNWVEQVLGPSLTFSAALVVNASLMFAAPLLAEIDETITPGTTFQQVWQPTRSEAGNDKALMRRFVRQSYDALRLIMAETTRFGRDDTKEWADAHGTTAGAAAPKTLRLMIAAAGNDSAEGLRHQASFPASGENTIGVGALGTSGTQAWYSNYADEVEHDNMTGPLIEGYLAFGGDAVPTPAEVSPTGEATPMPALTTNGVWGLSFDPADPDGWMRWSGTSFAAPIITGLVANLCAECRDSDERSPLQRLHHEICASDTPEGRIVEVTQS